LKNRTYRCPRTHQDRIGKKEIEMFISTYSTNENHFKRVKKGFMSQAAASEGVTLPTLFFCVLGFICALAAVVI
jgi:hypothetical protein